MNRTNYIFIDFENVQETDLERIANKPVQVTLILGERHKSLPIKLVRMIQKYSTQIRLVETVLNGLSTAAFYEANLESACDQSPQKYFHCKNKTARACDTGGKYQKFPAKAIRGFGILPKVFGRVDNRRKWVCAEPSFPGRARR